MGELVAFIIGLLLLYYLFPLIFGIFASIAGLIFYSIEIIIPILIGVLIIKFVLTLIGGVGKQSNRSNYFGNEKESNFNFEKNNKSDINKSDINKLKEDNTNSERNSEVDIEKLKKYIQSKEKNTKVNETKKTDTAERYSYLNDEIEKINLKEKNESKIINENEEYFKLTNEIEENDDFYESIYKEYE